MDSAFADAFIKINWGERIDAPALLVNRSSLTVLCPGSLGFRLFFSGLVSPAFCCLIFVKTASHKTVYCSCYVSPLSLNGALAARFARRHLA